MKRKLQNTETTTALTPEEQLQYFIHQRQILNLHRQKGMSRRKLDNVLSKKLQEGLEFLDKNEMKLNDLILITATDYVPLISDFDATMHFTDLDNPNLFNYTYDSYFIYKKDLGEVMNDYLKISTGSETLLPKYAACLKRVLDKAGEKGVKVV
jgi:hypothetical protein